MDIRRFYRNEAKAPEFLPLSSDVYFLIQRFLSNGALQRTLQTLNEELQEHKILPKRIDWEGNKHDRSVEDMEKQYPYVHQDFLYHLCRQASMLLNPNNPQLSSLLSFRPAIKDKKGIYYNFRQLHNYVTRSHGAPIHEVKSHFNIINSLRGREIAGPFSRHRAITPKIYGGIQNQRITLGHLSAVYCLLFDHSGRYIITGADDLLVKVWSTYSGRLIATLRGASSEITDIAIDSENELLAAGSIDKILRVWNIQTGVPLAVLTGHNGMITSVNFCPTHCWGLKYLISTSSDGSIAFWTYSTDTMGNVDFRNTPTMYQEKIRPGQAQMICSSFSPGGTFLATGSVDHHVRVYYMKGDEGPQRILETEAHTDRVDSIQWGHSGLRFLSGSKDGTAIIWWFERQQWKSILLDMTTKLPGEEQTSEFDGKKIKVTMVAWNRSGSLVVTAVSDHSLKVWDAFSGQLVKVLPGHKDEIYVLEPHPHDEDIILSAGHDGQLFIWDIHNGEIVARYLNNVEGQGHSSIFDAKWSPDGCVVAASDSNGNILTFSFGTGSPFYEQLPKELFFHTDYRPLVRDQNYWVLDEQTQVPPHLMPPPFLVDIDGNPYPPMLQRWVPGRENCNAEQLVPNIVIGNEGAQEVIQDVPRHLLEDSEEEDIRGNAGGSHRSERIRQSTGDWQTDHNIEWKKNVVVRPLNRAVLRRANEVRKLTEDAEMKEYQKQLRQRPHMISTAGPSNAKLKDKKKRIKGLRKPKALTSKYTPVEDEDLDRYDVVPLSPEPPEESSSSDWVEEVSETKKRSSTRTKRRPNVYNHRSSVDSDDDSSTTEESERTDEDEDTSDEEKENRKSRPNKENNRVLKEKARKVSPKPGTSKQSTTKASPKVAQIKPLQVVLTNGTAGPSKGPKIKVSEQYKLSEWLSETRPRKSPYYPQIYDEIVYFVQGHQLYVEAVRLKKVYEPNIKELPWTKEKLQDREFCKIIDIRYEIKPPRLCCLKLALQDEEGRFTGKKFTVRFHDMPDVLDFFVLKQYYQTAMSRDWQVGDKFRCMIDDNWWLGQITNKSPASDFYPDSAFMCYEICWTNGEQERMSPWDMEPLDESRVPEDDKAAVPVLMNELRSVLYKPTTDDWPNCERDTACKAITRGITQVMELAIAEPFLVPVDLNVYPTYALIVEYPIDLSTIKARFENNFYRRLAAAQFDIGYLETNAEKFNEKKSVIVKHAKILRELCLRIIRSGNDAIDIGSLYHQLVDGYDSAVTEDDEIDDLEQQPSTSRSLRFASARSWKSPDYWKVEARNLMDLMWQTEDSEPFRSPVNKAEYPAYFEVIKNPMDLGTVKEKLKKNRYHVPQEFCIDMRLIFQNSRVFNTNKRSRIYVMTVRLSSMFEEHIKKILNNWRISKKRQRRMNTSSEESDVSVSSSNVSSLNNTNPKVIDNSSPKVIVDNSNPKVIVVKNPIDINVNGNYSSDSDNTPLGMLKIVSRSNTATESDTTLDKNSSCATLDDRQNGSVDSDGRLSQNNYYHEIPGPSTSKHTFIQDFEHNYSSRTLAPIETKPTFVDKKKKFEDSDEDKPTTSRARSRKSTDKEYKPPNFVKRNNTLSDSDEKQSDSEYKPPNHLRISNKSSSSSDDVDDSDKPLFSRSLRIDDHYKTSASTRKTPKSSSESDDSDEGEALAKIKNSRLRKRKKKSSDEEFTLNETSSNSVIYRKGESNRRRRKNSSELDEDFKINNRSVKGKRKQVRRQQKPSFEVDEGDSDEEECSSKHKSSSSSSESEKELTRKSGLRQRPKRNRLYLQSESDSDSNLRKRVKRKRGSYTQKSDSSDDSDFKGSKGRVFESVSSRGRVRKITERAAAFLKKDKKG